MAKPMVHRKKINGLFQVLLVSTLQPLVCIWWSINQNRRFHFIFAIYFLVLWLFRSYWQNTSLTHFKPMLHFYTPWKHKKTRRFSDVFRGYGSGPLVENALIWYTLIGLLLHQLFEFRRLRRTFKDYSWLLLFNPFVPNALFLYPLKTSVQIYFVSYCTL